MRHLRKHVIECCRLAGPMLSLAAIVLVGGLGLHAVRDWHRHGGASSGFFHLHFHVGGHDHPHPAHDDHDRESPTEERQRLAPVFTVAQALHNDATAAQVATPRHATPDRTPINSAVLPSSSRPPATANPRAPPA